MIDKKDSYYEKIRNSLIGQRINEVFYQEINYEENTEYWNFASMIHSVDMNVIFKMDNGKIIQIKWDNEFYCYGIGLENLDKIENQVGFKTIDQTSNSIWTNLIDKKITGVKVLWDIDEHAKEQTMDKGKVISTREFAIHVPQTWEIEFESNKKIWISALEIVENGDAHYWDDHLTLFFDNNGQEKYELIKKTSAQHTI